MANPILLPQDLQEEFRTLPEPNHQLKRILASPHSEDLLTWNVFGVLRRMSTPDRWVPGLLKTAFNRELEATDFQGLEVKLWHGRRTKEFYPPHEHNDWLKARMKVSGIEGAVARAAKGARLEGPTEVDVVVESKRLLIFIEAKYLSDISFATSHDMCRDQITRNIDVGTYQASKTGKTFIFVLLTPARFEHSRLYWYKMAEYQSADTQYLRRALPHRAEGENKIDFEAVRLNLGWLLWRDVIAIWRRELAYAQSEGRLAGTDNEVQSVCDDFKYKGLTGSLDRR